MVLGDGMGSTKCIYDAVAGTRKEVFSLECNRIRHEEAKVNLGFLPPNFHLILGTVINAEDIAPLRESLSDGLKVWLDEDMSWMRQIPNVVDQLPKEIDVLIIDGGEFTGKMEFDLLAPRSKYIILDDTNATKHKETKKFLLESDTYQILDDNTYERNGFLICKNLL